MKILVILFLMIASISSPIHAQEMLRIDEELNFFDFSELDTIISHGSFVERTSLREIAMAALLGELDLSLNNIFSWLLQSIFAETASLLYLLRHMLIIAILSAFFKAMSTSFANSGIAELGFYISCVLVISLIFSSFMLAIGIMQSMVGNIVLLLQGATPIIITLLATGGFVASASAFAPTIIFAASFLTIFIERLLAPIIIFATTIHLLSFLLGKDKLEALSDFMKKTIKFCLKSVSMVFIAILSIQRLSTPLLNNLTMRSARFLVGSVPVVGSALTGAIETAIYYASAVRGAVAVALLISAVGLVIGPILQLVAFVAVYKLVAALIQPICDERIVKAMSAVGDYASLILGVCVMAGSLFIFIVLATLTI